MKYGRDSSGIAIMQVPQNSPEFLSLLQKSGLLTSDQIRHALAQLQLPDNISARDCAAAFVAARFITPFQAERIIEGRYRGLVIGSWRIREMLGFGGMGCVYIADAPGASDKVAIKVLAGQHAVDNGMLTRLQLEARAGMKLRHPGIIQTRQLESTGPVHFLVMQLIRGISLHELVALQGPQAPEVVCDFGMQVAEALHYAHLEGVIHRDIKPANFLIEPDGRIYVLDFGLAMLQDNAEDEFTLSMVFGHDCLGTPDYIAPEQSLDSRSIDARADVYSLGATLFVALTGRVPFPQKSTKAKLESRRSQAPRRVTDVNPAIPQEISDVIFRAMARDPDDRYANAREMADALRPFARRKPVSFDFRRLITLRAKQAKEKLEKAERRSSGPRSSITGNADWLRTIGSEAAFVAPSTPAARSWAPAAEKTARAAKQSASSLKQDDPTPTPEELSRVKADAAPVTKNPSTASPMPGPPPKEPAEQNSEKSAPTAPATATEVLQQTDWSIVGTDFKGVRPLPVRRYTIGASPSADFRLEGQSVDSQHGVLIWKDPFWEYQHLSEKCGTWYDGQPVTAAVTLQHNGLLQLGETAQLSLRHRNPQQLYPPRRINWSEGLKNLAFVTVLVTMVTVTAAAAVSLLRPDLLPESVQQRLLQNSRPKD